jgi:hypothetical protein
MNFRFVVWLTLYPIAGFRRYYHYDRRRADQDNNRIRKLTPHSISAEENASHTN